MVAVFKELYYLPTYPSYLSFTLLVTQMVVQLGCYDIDGVKDENPSTSTTSAQLNL